MKTKTELLELVDRLTAERDALQKDLDGQPDIKVINCVFEGENADGSQVMVFESDEIKTVKSFHLIGWRCFSPDKYDALQQRLTAADERADQAKTIIRKWKATFGESMARRSELYVMTDAFLSALKPAEGGGDEAV